MRKVLAVDAYITDNFVKATEKFSAFRSLNTHYRALEVINNTNYLSLSVC